MKVRFKRGFVVRHAKRESLLWLPRVSVCIIIEGAKPIIEEFTDEWRDEDEIADAVAEKCGCDIKDLLTDIHEVVQEFEALGFVELEAHEDLLGDLKFSNTKGRSRKLASYDNEYTILNKFCMKHCIPGDLHVDLTNACTERCVHCYVPQGQHDFLPYEMVEKALREFRAANGLSVHLTGGEAMLHPDFEKICRLCVELNLNFLIFSNMTLCDEKRVAFLKEVDPQFINVSLYSMDEVEHDAITCLLGSWRKTMDAILACEKAGVHIRLATPLLKANQGAFPALKRFADAHHMHLIPSCDIVPRANHTCSNLDYACSTAELEWALSSNNELFDRNWEGRMPKPDDKVCDIGEGRLYLNAKGNYYPCDCMHEYVLGNVRENTLDAIWQGEKLDYLRSLKNKDFGECASCENRPWCKVCPAFNFNATGDLFKTIPEKCVQSAVIHKIYGGK